MSRLSQRGGMPVTSGGSVAARKRFDPRSLAKELPVLLMNLAADPVVRCASAAG